jgi:mRNA interferase MazF
MPEVELARGDVLWVDLVGAVGHEKQGFRPCVVIQNNGGNTVSPLTIVAPITDADQNKGYAMKVFVSAAELGTDDAKDSVNELGHIRSIDRDHRIDQGWGIWCHLSDEVMANVDRALHTSLAI